MVFQLVLPINTANIWSVLVNAAVILCTVEVAAGSIATIQKLRFQSCIDMAATSTATNAGKWRHWPARPASHFLVEAWLPIAKGKAICLRSISFCKTRLFSNLLF